VDATRARSAGGWLGVLSARRQVNLRRWARRRESAELRRTSAAWLESHFDLIERGAPWLRLVGRDVEDSCSAVVRDMILTLAPGPGAGAGCAQKVTAVYGCDGPLVPRLRSLDQALPTAGWKLGTPALPQSWADLDPAGSAAATGLIRSRTRWMTDRRVNLRWWPDAALRLPPDGDRMRPWGHPPPEPRMHVTWCSRGQETGWVRPPMTRRVASRNYLPLGASESRVPDLLEEVLARCEHALTVTIEFSYYSNPNPKARPHRMPRYLIPTVPRF
jgi:hypothetical protein